MEDIAAWLAPAATTLAALMTASNLGSRITGFGFAVFTIGSIAWLSLGIATGQPSLIWQNIILTILNLFGIWAWLFRQARIDEGGRSAQEESRLTPGETLFPVSLLLRTKLIAKDAAEVGTTIDAMVEGVSGRIAYVVLSEGGVAGVGEKLRRIDWARIRFDQDALVTSLSPERIAAFPELAKDEWPGR